MSCTGPVGFGKSTVTPCGSGTIPVIGVRTVAGGVALVSGALAAPVPVPLVAVAVSVWADTGVLF